MSADPEKVGTPLHLVFAHPGLVDQFGGVNSSVVLELEQGQLTGNLQRMVLQEKEVDLTLKLKRCKKLGCKFGC